MEDRMHHGASPKLFSYARQNRKAMTKAEKILWESLRDRKLAGHKFRRQHPIGNFIADFFCLECNLIVEVDGGYHNTIEQVQYDEGRSGELDDLNITVIRFTNEEVLDDLKTVLYKIESTIKLIKNNS